MKKGRTITSIILFLGLVFLGVMVLGYINSYGTDETLNFSANSLFK